MTTDALRERMREIALDEFAEKGVEGTSLGTIAERAGCTKQNILYHFGTKQSLLEAVLEPFAAAADSLIARHSAGEVPDLAREVVEVLIANRNAAAVLLFYHGSLPAPVLVRRLFRIIELLASDLAPNDPQGTFRALIAVSGLAYVAGAEALPGSVDDDIANCIPDLLNPEPAAHLLRTMITPGQPGTADQGK